MMGGYSPGPGLPSYVAVVGWFVLFLWSWFVFWVGGIQQGQQWCSHHLVLGPCVGFGNVQQLGMGHSSHEIGGPHLPVIWNWCYYWRGICILSWASAIYTLLLNTHWAKVARCPWRMTWNLEKFEFAEEHRWHQFFLQGIWDCGGTSSRRSCWEYVLLLCI